MKRYISIFVNILALLSALLFLGCSDASNNRIDALINHTEPFGISQALTTKQLEIVRRKIEEKCEIYFNLSGEQSKIITEINYKICLNSAFHSTILLDVPNLKNTENLTITTKNGAIPLMWELSYLHSLEDDAENIKKRQIHAKKFRKRLIKKYGKSSLKVNFDHFFLTDLRKDSKEDYKCEVWLVEIISIILCDQRVVYTDGFEMSLSFVQLDQVPFGDQFIQKMNSSKIQLESGHTFNYKFFGDFLEEQYISQDSILSSIDNFPDETVKKRCDKNNIEPLTKRAKLSKPILDLITAEAKNLSADNLAYLGIEIASRERLELNDDDREKSATYLLLESARRGSAIGMNEIGASQLYCYLGVEQNMPQGVKWVQSTASKGDLNARYNLARVILAQKVNVSDPVASIKALLESCAKQGSEDCKKDLATITDYEPLISRILQ